jgi:hypothetical protein
MAELLDELKDHDSDEDNNQAAVIPDTVCTLCLLGVTSYWV